MNGLEEEAFGGVAGLEGGTAGAAFFGGGAGAEIEAAHGGGSVAGEAVGLEDLEGGVFCARGEAEEEREEGAWHDPTISQLRERRFERWWSSPQRMPR